MKIEPKTSRMMSVIMDAATLRAEDSRGRRSLLEKETFLRLATMLSPPGRLATHRPTDCQVSTSVCESLEKSLVMREPASQVTPPMTATNSNNTTASAHLLESGVRRLTNSANA